VNTLQPLLSWSHYRLIINVEEEQAQLFYMNKAADNHWSAKQLTQQIESHYYHRTLSVKTKEHEHKGLPKDELQYEPSDLIIDPDVHEFLDTKPSTGNLKRVLNQAVLDKIQDFFLELANGFCLVTRQKHLVTEQNNHYHIDLVFYNYLLRCFVLINLSLGALTNEDELIMDRYVQMYDDKFKPKDDNPTFGILICSNNGETEVKYTSLNDRKQIFLSLYQMVIPSKEELADIVNDEMQRLTSEIQLKE
jgi:predicted nuclease of restriction endonuclease-like (RecB) superfamily